MDHIPSIYHNFGTHNLVSALLYKMSSRLIDARSLPWKSITHLRYVPEVKRDGRIVQIEQYCVKVQGSPEVVCLEPKSVEEVCDEEFLMFVMRTAYQNMNQPLRSNPVIQYFKFQRTTS